MAKDKSSFILYSDTVYTVEKLTDEKAGQLFKHILAYVNDQNPQTDDILIQIAFEPIKQQLKRDLRKWDSYINKQTNNGKKGGRPRKAKQTEKTQAFFEKPKKADTVTVTVTGTVIGTDTEYKTPKQLMAEYKSIEIEQLEMKIFQENKDIDFDFAFEQWSLSVESKEFTNNGTQEQIQALFASLRKWMNSWKTNQKNKNGKFSNKGAQIGNIVSAADSVLEQYRNQNNKTSN